MLLVFVGDFWCRYKCLVHWYDRHDIIPAIGWLGAVIYMLLEYA